jgi:hypothetical protein
MSDTVLDGLTACVRRALAYDPNVRVAPAALLWPDEARQFEPVTSRLGQHLPIVTLGAYEPGTQRGPAYWIRCVIARTIDIGLPEDPPIVYLPGVARSALRAVEQCPADLAPIAELQYRSQWFAHPNGRDWSARALLSHPGRGLGLRISDDTTSNDALLLALDRLLDERIDRLAKLTLLDADFFHDLVNPDPMRSLLGWLDDPPDYRKRLDTTQWTAFVQQCKSDFGFNPETDGDVIAARKLAAREGKWASVWDIFASAPERHPGIPDQLRKARPQEQLSLLGVAQSEVWPQDNEIAEDQLRNRLRDFEALTPQGAREEAVRLDGDHAWRRRTVWAKLDTAPLAFSLEQLARLAQLTGQPLAETDLISLTADYAERGWRADDAALRALALAPQGSDRDAVAAAVSAMYRWWLDAGGRVLLAAVGPMANSHTYEPGSRASTAKGTTTVFVDGLRLDLAHRLQDRLASTGFDVEMKTTLAALPTVTETAKPALVPVPGGSLNAGEELWAARTSSGAKAAKAVLESLAADAGVQWLPQTETGDPSGVAWTEAGQIDHFGHELGSSLVDEIDREIDKIARRVRGLLEVGWLQVDVLTDHGWYLVPGGLEKVELPVAATAKKKGRCARLKEGAVVEVPTVPWFWDQDVRIAVAPGASCFEANKEYEHGGVSPQECIVPRLSVKPGSAQPTAEGPEVLSIKWLGLLCRIELAGVSADTLADLRALPGDPNTSIADAAKETAGANRVSLVVPDEDLEGERAYFVLVASDGRLLAQREVVVGRNQ